MHTMWSVCSARLSNYPKDENDNSEQVVEGIHSHLSLPQIVEQWQVAGTSTIYHDREN